MSDEPEIIYRRIASMDKSSMIEVDDMLGILFYLCARLKYGFKKHTERDIFSELVAKMTDYIYSCKDAGFFSETCPYTVYSKGIVFLFATCRIYELGIHCGRLSKIWTEVKHRLFQYIPYMQASRLQVMLVAKKVAILNNDMEWHSYSSFLRENFSWISWYVMNTETDRYFLPMDLLVLILWSSVTTVYLMPML